MDKQQIIDYIMHTPSNTNPAMLGQFLDEYSGGSGENWNTFFEGEITTEEQDGVYLTRLSESDYIDADKIKVTFNGTKYVCNKTVITDDGNIYGGSFNEEYEPVFSNCPFVIESYSDDGAALYTESPGTHSIKIEVPQESGGSGDWSTAEVTFINYAQLATVEIPNIRLMSNKTGESFLATSAIGIFSGPETTFIVPLYKGYCVFKYEGSFTSSGNINQISENMAIITGDGTITLGDDGGK